MWLAETQLVEQRLLFPGVKTVTSQDLRAAIILGPDFQFPASERTFTWFTHDENPPRHVLLAGLAQPPVPQTPGPQPGRALSFQST